MIGLGFIKRFLPFVAAFAVGIFITSLFVDIGWGRFGRGRHHRQSYCELQAENERLRAENERMTQVLREMNVVAMPSTAVSSDGSTTFAVPMPAAPPAMPPVPAVPKGHWHN